MVKYKDHRDQGALQSLMIGGQARGHWRAEDSKYNTGEGGSPDIDKQGVIT